MIGSVFDGSKLSSVLHGLGGSTFGSALDGSTLGSALVGSTLGSYSTLSSCDGVECVFAFPEGDAPSGASVHRCESSSLRLGCGRCYCCRCRCSCSFDCGYARACS